MPNQSQPQSKATKRKQNKSQMRTLIFSFLIGLGLLSVLTVYYTETKDKNAVKQEPIVLGNVDDESTINTKNLSNYGHFVLPNNFNKKTMKDSKVQFLVSSQDGVNKLAHIKGVPMTEKDSKIYTINNLQFYAKFLQEKIYPVIKVANTDDYINLDEFSNENYTYFALAYDEGDHFKYVVINVFNAEGGKKYVSYTIIQLSKEIKDFYSESEVSVETHKEIMTEIFSLHKE